MKVHGRGSNQESSLRRPGDTRWGSHYSTIVSVISLFSPIVSLVNIIQNDPKNDSVRTEASAILFAMEDFEFVFILHLMEMVLSITYELSQSLQRKDQDLANAIALVRVAKVRLQNLKSVKFDVLLDLTTEFCKKHDVDIPNMGDFYCPKGRSRRNASTLKFWEFFKFMYFDKSMKLLIVWKMKTSYTIFKQ
ncbi:unnamed protein product [Cuscuta campestris]|uniref:Uncharacterized protein n=1 Tax=Cuscuta campestris TaxID=132261 RepID=A0A484M5F2_9ASTE|nr:unnamed protein product [Cuscuta campestris]